MARKSKNELPEDDEPGLDISSLIDICFLLLIYFLVSTTIVPKERDQPSTIPTTASENSDKSEISPFYIEIDQGGLVSTRSGDNLEPLDQDPSVRTLPLLDSRLNLYASAARTGDQQPLVNLNVKGEADYQRVIDVLNTLAKYKIKEVTFTDSGDS